MKPVDTSIILAVWIAAFLIGTVTHTLELIADGWLPYRFVPRPINIFWTSLTFIDPLIVLLLLRRRNAGILLGLLVMLLHVAVNSYTVYVLGFPELMLPLQLQALFFGFTLGSFRLIWIYE